MDCNLQLHFLLANSHLKRGREAVEKKTNIENDEISQNSLKRRIDLCEEHILRIYDHFQLYCISCQELYRSTDSDSELEAALNDQHEMQNHHYNACPDWKDGGTPI